MSIKLVVVSIFSVSNSGAVCIKLQIGLKRMYVNTKLNSNDTLVCALRPFTINMQ